MITDQDVNDLVATAVESGGFYWATHGDARLVRPDLDNVDSWFYALPFTVTDEAGKRLEVTEDVVRRGIVLRADAKGLTVRRFIEEHDAFDADDAIQMGLFGQLVYG